MLAIAGSVTGLAMAQGSSIETGRIGPKKKLLVSGRKLSPAGKLSGLGNFPTGGALTTNGRFLWTLAAGRGTNDIRILEVGPYKRCKPGKRGRSCRKRVARRVGRVVQTIPMPGLSGGIAMSPDNRTAYVSGVSESGNSDYKVGADVPGKKGDVIHVFRYDGRTGKATRDGVIDVPPPSDAPAAQAFPPSTTKISWPRDLALSRDGKTLLAALNLADYAAVIDTGSRKARFVKVKGYPYGAAITRDGKSGLVSNEVDGTVSVIDLDSAKKVKDITVGPHLSHPEAITIDPKSPRAYVAVTHQDLISVINTDKMEVERSMSVERPEGIGTAPVHLAMTRDGCRLLSANSGEDTLAVFAIPQKRCDGDKKRRRARASAEATADAILQHEARRGGDYARSPLAEEEEEGGEEGASVAAVKRPKAFSLIGKIPTGSYPAMVGVTPKTKKLVYVAAKGLGTGPNTRKPGEPSIKEDTGSATAGAPEQYRFHYLPTIVNGLAGIRSFPTDKQIKKYTPKASRQALPINRQDPPPGTPITKPGAGQKIEYVFYFVKENRTYDQVLGDDSRGDGDPKLTLFGEKVTPNLHALARRFPLLDHVYANSEASIDGHFWTSAASVSDYVHKAWNQNYGARKRPYDFGAYVVTYPARKFLVDEAERKGIPYFNYGEAVSGISPLPDKDRNDAETAENAKRFANSDIGPPAAGCYHGDLSIGTVLGQSGAPEVYDSSLPPGAPPTAQSRFDCFKNVYFTPQIAQNKVPKFNMIMVPNNHTVGTSPGSRTPRSMIADNDYALGQFVDLISHSPVWPKSLILVIEDDSQDGADHVDAHRIPALAISPYAKRGAVVHTRYDFLSVIRTMEITLGMDPLNLFDAVAVPMYDAFDAEPNNSEAFDAIVPEISRTERNTEASPGAALSKRLPWKGVDQVPQRVLDRLLWQSVHGAGSEPPPPGPNASGADDAAFELPEP